MTLAERVKQRRIELDLTQEQLAAKMGYSSKVSISKIENGRPISQKIIVKLAEVLETTPSYLMGWEEPRKLTKFEIDFLLDGMERHKTNKTQELFNYISDNNLSDDEINEVKHYIEFVISKRNK